MEHEHIDVIADFSYDSENPQYNRDFRLWRQKNQASYIYRYTNDKNERVYVSGKASGFASAAHAERQALIHASARIGLAMLIYLFCELLCGSLLIWLFSRLGFDIALDFLTFTMRGSQWTVTAVRVFVVLLKYGIPTCVLLRCFRYPTAVAAPVAFGALPESIAAVGFGALCAAVFCLTAQSSGIETAQRLFTYKDAGAIAAYGLFDVLIVSLLAELLLRGAVLSVLRQFGDAFAICLTAAIAFLLPNELPERLCELLLGLVSGYLFIRSGSVTTCVLLRAVCFMLNYARLILVYTNNTITLSKYVLLLTVFGILSVAFFFWIRKGRCRISNWHTHLTWRQKLFAGTQSVIALSWAAGSVLLLMLQLFY